MGRLSRGLVLLFRTFSGLRRLSRGGGPFFGAFMGFLPVPGAWRPRQPPEKASPQNWAPFPGFCTLSRGFCHFCHFFGAL